MSVTLRLVLVAVSLVTVVFVVRRIRRSQLQLDDALFWLIFAFAVLLSSIFPQVFYVLADFVGIASPSNFVFLFFIFVLLIKCFSMSIRISQSDMRVRELTQHLAIEKFERHDNDKMRDNVSLGRNSKDFDQSMVSKTTDQRTCATLNTRFLE